MGSRIAIERVLERLDHADDADMHAAAREFVGVYWGGDFHRAAFWFQAAAYLSGGCDETP